VLALPLADILVRHPDPAVVVGVRDHPLDEVAVRFLDVGAAAELRLSLAHPDDEGVANALELGRPEHARAADRSDAPIDAAAREGGRPELTQLSLESGDLAAKLVAQKPIVAGADEIELVPCLLCQYLRHDVSRNAV
jgi:hypothetical protein